MFREKATIITITTIMDKSMTEDEVVGTVDEDLVDSTTCDGVCGRKVYEGATVDVVTGKVSDESKGNVTVQSVEDKSVKPEVEKWCVQCAEAEFGVKKEAGERTVEETNTYITPSNVLAFFVGGLTIYLLMLPF